jgi:glutathione S-transferase
MKLYDFPLAPNPRRVNRVIIDKGLDIPRIQVDLMNEPMPPELQHLNRWYNQIASRESARATAAE